MNSRLICAAAGAALVLTACGGGGGGDDEAGGTPVVSPTADITPDNYTTLAEPVVRALFGVDMIAGSTLAALGASADRAHATAAGAASASATGWVALAWQLLRHDGFDRARPQQVQQDGGLCGNGGSYRTLANDADNNQDYSRGDSLTIDFDHCGTDSASPSVNGRLVLQVNGTTRRSGEIVGFDTQATFTAFEPGNGARLDGGARLQLDVDTQERVQLRIGYQKLTATDTARQKTVVYDFALDGRFDGATGSFTVGGAIGIDGLTYTLDTPQQLVFDASGRPSGKLRMRDATSDALQFVAVDDLTFELQFVPAGATAPTRTTSGLTWSNYLGL